MVRTPAINPNQTLEIYKLAVEMADRVSQRRQSNNNFYLTVNTAIVGAVAYLAKENAGSAPMGFISLAGAIICLAWIWSIRSYRSLNRAKFAVIHKLEDSFTFRPYTLEWGELTDGKGERHVQFHTVEVVVPWVFGSLHCVNLIAAAPWHAILNLCK